MYLYVLKKKKKKGHGCSHDNGLMSGFLPPSEPLEPVHLRNMFQKENLRSFLKNDV